jgi:hypothetical protein
MTSISEPNQTKLQKQFIKGLPQIIGGARGWLAAPEVGEQVMPKLNTATFQFGKLLLISEQMVSQLKPNDFRGR